MVFVGDQKNPADINFYFGGRETTETHFFKHPTEKVTVGPLIIEPECRRVDYKETFINQLPGYHKLKPFNPWDYLTFIGTYEYPAKPGSFEVYCAPIDYISASELLEYLKDIGLLYGGTRGRFTDLTEKAGRNWSCLHEADSSGETYR